jgi:hypothetical protein
LFHVSSTGFIGGVHGRLGEKDAAFDWLEKAFQQHESFLVYFKGNSRCPQILKRDSRQT